jgi:hypothetical protein
MASISICAAATRRSPKYENVLLVAVTTTETPRVSDEDAVVVTPIADGITRVELRFGFMERPDVPKGLEVRSFTFSNNRHGRFRKSDLQRPLFDPQRHGRFPRRVSRFQCLADGGSDRRGGYVGGEWDGGGTHMGPAFKALLVGSLPPATGRARLAASPLVMKT